MDTANYEVFARTMARAQALKERSREIQARSNELLEQSAIACRRAVAALRRCEVSDKATTGGD